VKRSGVSSIGGWILVVAVVVAETSSVGVVVRGGSNEATEEGRVSVVPVTGVAIDGTSGALSSGGVGCPVSSLKVAILG